MTATVVLAPADAELVRLLQRLEDALGAASPERSRQQILAILDSADALDPAERSVFLLAATDLAAFAGFAGGHRRALGIGSQRSPQKHGQSSR
jgi:hypothetical protein